MGRTVYFDQQAVVCKYDTDSQTTSILTLTQNFKSSAMAFQPCNFYGKRTKIDEMAGGIVMAMNDMVLVLMQ